MSHPTPYLSFDGRCADAMRFYQHALGATLEIMMRNGESPWAAQMGPDSADRVLHASLALPGGGRLYAGDCPPSMPFEGVKGMSLTLDYATVDEAARVFAALSEGGHVTMPPQPAFWARHWGMLIDRFGIPWIVNGERIAF